MADEEARRERQRKARRRWDLANPEKAAESRRRWKQANPERVRATQNAWREKNLERSRELNRESMRRVAQRARAAELRRARAATRARQRCHADIEASRAKAREYRAARRAADPEAFLAARRRDNQAYRERRGGEINTRRREQYQRDPEGSKATSRRYYERHFDEIKERRQRYREANREKVLEQRRGWQRLSRRLQSLGLPPRRVHRVAPAEKKENQSAADAYFAHPVTEDFVKRVSAEQGVRLDVPDEPTPQHLIDAWRRECYRMKAARYARLHPEVSPRVTQRRTTEEARMDAIAKVFNDRLRATPPQRRPAPGLTDPPTTTAQPDGFGL